MSLEAGQVIDGKYRIVRLIGTGGMGAVYEGENTLIRRRVAIKVLHAGSTQNQDLIRRFEREAQAAGEIGNDHILEVLDVGSLPNGDRFMVMEFLDGETLSMRIDRHGHLTPQQIAPLARQFLTALASAHEAGIIHRDLKPDNIFILRSKAGRADFVKLIDFGISKFSRRLNEVGHKTTHHGAVLGTPCYMSPEQARGKGEADVRSDIYSCGVILYEAVTGRLPFEAETFNDLMFKIALSDAPSPLTIIPSLDPEFAWLIARAMAREPKDRFQSVQSFAEALDEWMRKNSLTKTLTQPPPADAFPAARSSLPGDPPSAPRVSKPQEVTVAESIDDEVDSLQFQKTGTDESWAHSKAEPPKRNRRAILAAASATGLLVVILGFALLSRGSSAPSASGAEGATSTVSTTTSNARPPPTGVDLPPPSPELPAPPQPSASAARPTSTASTAPTSRVAVGAPTAAPKPKPAASRKVIDLGY